MAFSLRMHLFRWKRHVYSSISSWRVFGFTRSIRPKFDMEGCAHMWPCRIESEMTLLWCTSGMCWFIFSRFSALKNKPPWFFCRRMLKLKTQSFLVSKSWYWSIPINSPTVATIPTQTCSESNRKIRRPRHMDLTSRRCCHRESLALKFYTLKKLTAGIQPSNCKWWCGEFYLFPLDHVRF